jgi:hypothetical protein
MHPQPKDALHLPLCECGKELMEHIENDNCDLFTYLPATPAKCERCDHTKHAHRGGYGYRNGQCLTTVDSVMCECRDYSPAPPTQAPPAGELEGAEAIITRGTIDLSFACPSCKKHQSRMVDYRIVAITGEECNDCGNIYNVEIPNAPLAGFAAAPSKAEIVEAFIAQVEALGAADRSWTAGVPFDWKKAMRAVADRISKGGKI